MENCHLSVTGEDGEMRIRTGGGHEVGAEIELQGLQQLAVLQEENTVSGYLDYELITAKIACNNDNFE